MEQNSTMVLWPGGLYSPTANWLERPPPAAFAGAILAHMWLNLAAAKGDTDAIKNRDRVATKMTPAQIAEAQKLAREWKLK